RVPRFTWDKARRASPRKGRRANSEVVMLNVKTMAIAATLALGVSGLALAQTSTTAPTKPGSGTTAPSAGTSSSTTAGSGSSVMTEADVKQKLEKEGYSQVTDVKKDKDGYTAKAMKGGKQVMLDVDKNGKVQAK